MHMNSFVSRPDHQPQLLEVIPDPISLMESMRAVGYSLESAIADLIDNSISAQAAQVHIQYDATSPEPYVAILDDGYGMTPDQLTNAMRHGSSNPSDARHPDDLGRFGLGLKTASLSQCRKLTVISKREETVSARQWNLDVVQDEGRWVVVVPGESELRTLPLYKRLIEQANGTLVIWQELDRLISGAVDPQKEMTTRLSPLMEHLALVFHRFAKAEGSCPATRITINGLPVPERDPFLAKNHFRQPLEGQVIRHELGNVQIQPFVLPPISNLSPDEIELAGGREGLRGTQGFYVYRNRRLVIWGTWFRLVPKEEFYKLTRIQVDIPNTFDELWALDIKKSAAYPPEVIRERPRPLSVHFAGVSKKTITARGGRTMLQDYPPAWCRLEPSRHSFRYEVNNDHPMVQRLADSLDEPGKRMLDTLFSLLEESLPLEAIYSDMCGDQRGGQEQEVERLLALAQSIKDCLPDLEIGQLLAMDPFVRHPDLHEQLRKELTK